MIGSPIPIYPNSVIGVIGDSKVRSIGQSSWVYRIAQEVNALYSAPRGGFATVPGTVADNATLAPGATAGAPMWYPSGKAGTVVADYGSLLTALAAAAPTCDTLLVDFETNDAHNLVTDAVYTTGINALIPAALVALPRLTAARIMWLQAPCLGEQLPFGTNTWDTVTNGLMGKDAVLRSRAAALSFNVCEFRTNAAGDGPWTDYETIHNGSNVASGILMTSDKLHNLTYPTRVGIDWHVTQVLTGLTVSGVG